MLTPKKTNDEIKTKGYTFSPVSDIKIEESCFYVHVELKFHVNNFLSFLVSLTFRIIV